MGYVARKREMNLHVRLLQNTPEDVRLLHITSWIIILYNDYSMCIDK